MAMSNDGAAALKNFEMENGIKEASGEDTIYRYDEDKHREALEAAAWTSEYVHGCPAGFHALQRSATHVDLARAVARRLAVLRAALAPPLFPAAPVLGWFVRSSAGRKT